MTNARNVVVQNERAAVCGFNRCLEMVLKTCDSFLTIVEVSGGLRGSAGNEFRQRAPPAPLPGGFTSGQIVWLKADIVDTSFDSEEALGHPRVWLQIPDDTGFVECGYCDKRFILKGGPADTSSTPES